MPILRPCLDCHQLTPTPRCPACRSKRKQQRLTNEPWQAWYSTAAFKRAAAQCRARAGGRCEVVHGSGRCPNPGTQAHHTKPARLCTAAEFVDHTMLMLVCDRCHPHVESVARRAFK
jgi:hypothetical protein